MNIEPDHGRRLLGAQERDTVYAAALTIGHAEGCIVTARLGDIVLRVVLCLSCRDQARDQAERQEVGNDSFHGFVLSFMALCPRRGY